MCNTLDENHSIYNAIINQLVDVAHFVPLPLLCVCLSVKQVGTDALELKLFQHHCTHNACKVRKHFMTTNGLRIDKQVTVSCSCGFIYITDHIQLFPVPVNFGAMS